MTVCGCVGACVRITYIMYLYVCYISTVTRQNLITTFFQMFRRDKKLLDIPSYFNVFGLDNMRF